jgi:hypothetical protein
MARASHSTSPPEREREFWSGIEHLSTSSMGEASLQLALRDLPPPDPVRRTLDRHTLFVGKPDTRAGGGDHLLR